MKATLEMSRLLMARLMRSENTLLMALAVAVGLLSGAAVWAFGIGIDAFHALFVEWLAQQVLAPVFSAAGIILALIWAGALVGWIMQRFIGEERHHGVAGVIEAVALAGGRLRYSRIPFKAVASALSLGAGASVGPEDPSVQIGANLGSLLGQKLRLSDERVRLLVAAGAASAIASAFRAPIAGVFFALEVILNREFATGSFGVVVLAAVIASVFTQAIEVGGPEFGLRHFTLGGLLDIPLYILLGLFLAPVAAVMIRAVYWQHDLWRKHARQLSRPARTALAGGLVGVVAVFLPQIMGPGREVTTAVLSDSRTFTVLALLALGAAKLVMTAVSLAGGFVGGIFAPSLFVGTMFGAAFGRLATVLLPASAIGDPEAFAIVGMAAVMAGVVRAPITAILLVFELTNDYLLILPIMLTTVVCVSVAERIEPLGIYMLGLSRKGIRLQDGRDFDVMESVIVGDAMRPVAPTIREDASLLRLRDALRAASVRSMCVVNRDGALVGIVTLTDLQRAYERGADGLTVGRICTRAVVTASPRDSLSTAIRKMGARDFGRLPVTDPYTGRIVGMLSRDDVVRAYTFAMQSREEARTHLKDRSS
jgi:CIC family chloride channel protein